MKTNPALAWILLLLLPASPLHAKEGAIQCGNLIYGGTHTSRCFSDEFLSNVQRRTSLVTERRFKSVKLGSSELFTMPFVIITGEKDFHFTRQERENLKKYLESGGFLLASAGCSNKDWDISFRREIKRIFGSGSLTKIPMEHPIFRTVHEVRKIKLHREGSNAGLLGLQLNGKIVAIYSPHGLNNTENTQGCCCCGGNEIENSLEINTNIFVYALLY